MVDFLRGRKTYLVAVGLIGLGIYQLTQTQWDAAYQSLGQALVAFGLRQAIASK